MIKKIKHIATTTGLLIISSPVSATYPYYDVDTDLGAYSPIALGEDFVLNACNTQFSSSSTGASFNVCDLTDLNDFRFTWRISQNGQLLWKQTFKNNNATNGLSVSLATGPGTTFSTVGNYAVSLIVRVRNNVNVQLPNNGWGQTGDNGKWNRADSGFLNIDKSTSTYTVEATPVPEPAAALLLVPALALIRRREKQQKMSHIASKDAA